jgi:cobalamin biosynthetic protein CobC
LDRDSRRLDALIQSQGWMLVGGTALFRLYDTGVARATQARLATAHIWSRIFGERPAWLRLGLPGDETEWARLAAALAR